MSARQQLDAFVIHSAFRLADYSHIQANTSEKLLESLMRYYWLLPILLAGGCASSTSADFKILPLAAGLNCSILYDGAAPLVMPDKKADFVYGVGDGCPSLFPDKSGVKIRKHRTMELGGKNNYVRAVTAPDSKTGVFYKLIIRRNIGDKKRLGMYRVLATKSSARLSGD